VIEEAPSDLLSAVRSAIPRRAALLGLAFVAVDMADVYKARAHLPLIANNACDKDGVLISADPQLQ